MTTEAITERAIDNPKRRLRGLWTSSGLEEVEDLMLRMATGERLDRLGLVVREHLLAGGKRLRARLALAAAEALGVPRHEAVAWAAACELLHNATLIHDDLQDGDRYRRGQLATWARYGAAQAINAGDLLLMLPYAVLEHVPVSADRKWFLAQALARHAELVVRGQAAELDLLPMGRLDWEGYRSSVEGKTAALFSLPVEGAAIIAGWAPERATLLGNTFAPIGTLFQVQDDVLDLYGDKGRDVPGSDIREGKVSALVVEHLRLHPEERAWLVGLLTTPRDETAEHDVVEAIRRFADGGALQSVWDRMAQIEDMVIDADVLTEQSRLQACATELIAMALMPIRHVSPELSGRSVLLAPQAP